MRILIFLCLVAVTTNWSCTSYRVEKDLSMFCEEAEKINQDSFLTTNEKIWKWSQRVHPLLISRKAKGLFFRFSVQSETATYSQFEELGIENKVENWSCEALETLFEAE